MQIKAKSKSLKKFSLEIKFLLIFAFLTVNSFGQNFLQFKLGRELTNFYWTGIFSLSLSREMYSFKITERFSSLTIKTAKSFIRDDNFFTMSFDRKFSKLFNASVVLNSVSFVDEKLTSFSKASTSEIFLGGKINFPRIGLYAGFKSDNQMNQRDEGFTYKIAFDTTDIEFSNYHLQGNLLHQEDFIPPRRNITSGLNIKLWRRFAQETESKVEFTFKRNRRDFYFFADSTVSARYGVANNIEGRDETAIGGGLSLAYPLVENLTLNFGGNINGRKISKEVRYKTSSLYDVKINELSLAGFVSFQFENDFIKINSGFNYAERNELHTPQINQFITETSFLKITRIEEQKNNNSFRRSINAELTFKLSRRTQLGAVLFSSLLRYDTPSNLNSDDRDELLQMMRIFLKTQITNAIKLEIPLDLNALHLVYIYAERSINNNWNRIIKLSPSLLFETEKIYNRSTFSVLANYTVYDFEGSTPSVKSYVFRQFYLTDSLNVVLAKKISLEGRAQLILSESGWLNWKEFSERPTLFINTNELSFLLNYAIANSKFSIGFRTYSEKRYRYIDLEKIPDSKISASGPMCRIETKMSQRFYIYIDGWIEKLIIDGRANLYSNMNLNLVLNL